MGIVGESPNFQSIVSFRCQERFYLGGACGSLQRLVGFAAHGLGPATFAQRESKEPFWATSNNANAMVILKDFPMVFGLMIIVTLVDKDQDMTGFTMVLNWDRKSLMKISLPAAQERFGLVKALGSLTKRTGFEAGSWVLRYGIRRGLLKHIKNNTIIRDTTYQS